jgi:hypothetical protein
MRGVGLRMGLWASLLALVGCTRTLPIRVELEDARAPSPRSDGFRRNVQTLRVKALVGGNLEILPDTGANEGEVRIDDTIAPTVRRLVVEGLDEDQQVFASGQSAPLDLLRDPPEDGIVTIYFSRVGELSLTAERGAIRQGMKALSLDGERVLFAGGIENGCTPIDTELYEASETRISVGPVLAGGRVGDFRIVPLPNGEVMVAGGDEAPCGSSTATRASESFGWLRFDPLGSDTRTPGVRFPNGAAIGAVSDREVVLAGGLVGDTATETVLGLTFDEQGSSLIRIGGLGLQEVPRPRAFASIVPITELRLLLVGGSTTSEFSGALGTATAFIPSSGLEIEAEIALLERVIEPGVASALSGSVWIAGGRDATGAGSTTLQSVVVRRASESSLGDGSLGDAAAMNGELPVGMARPTILPVGTAGALVVPDDETSLAFVDSFGVATAVERDPQLGLVGPLVGGAIGDGTIVLRDASGSYVRFNPGPVAVLGAAGGADGRSLGSSSGPLGISFLRPGAWERSEAGIRNKTFIAGSNTPPGELAILSDESFGDFVLEVDYTPGPLGQPALIFSFAPGDYAYYDLSSFTRLLKVGPGVIPDCVTLVPTGISDPVRHTVVLRRSGLRLTLQVDAESFVCDVDADSRFAVAGPLGLGVINGQVTFERVRISED